MQVFWVVSKYQHTNIHTYTTHTNPYSTNTKSNINSKRNGEPNRRCANVNGMVVLLCRLEMFVSYLSSVRQQTTRWVIITLMTNVRRECLRYIYTHTHKHSLAHSLANIHTSNHCRSLLYSIHHIFESMCYRLTCMLLCTSSMNPPQREHAQWTNHNDLNDMQIRECKWISVYQPSAVIHH